VRSLFGEEEPLRSVRRISSSTLSLTSIPNPNPNPNPNPDPDPDPNPITSPNLIPHPCPSPDQVRRLSSVERANQVRQEYSQSVKWYADTRLARYESAMLMGP